MKENPHPATMVGANKGFMDTMVKQNKMLITCKARIDPNPTRNAVANTMQNAQSNVRLRAKFADKLKM